MVSRNREAEHEVPVEYLHAVHNLHEKVFVDQAHELGCPVFIIESGNSTTIPEIGRDIVRMITHAQLDQDIHNCY